MSEKVDSPSKYLPGLLTDIIYMKDNLKSAFICFLSHLKIFFIFKDF